MQGNNLVIVIDGESHTITQSNINYNRIIQAVKDRDWDAVPDLVSPEKTVVNFGAGNIQIQDGEVFWRGRALHNSLTKQIVRMIQEGFDVDPMVNFMENLMHNPSHRAVQELYAFLEKGELPITPDGCFLAYKNVNRNFRDLHSGTVINKPAHLLEPSERAQMPVTVTNEVTTRVVQTPQGDRTEVSMPRNAVDDDAQRTCSVGLHFCSRDYLDVFGGRDGMTLILKIDPADVVSIPADHGDTKGRTWRYQVEGVLGGDPDTAFTSSVQDWYDDLGETPDDWSDSEEDQDWL